MKTEENESIGGVSWKWTIGEEGLSTGVEVLELDNGVMKIELLPTRGMGIRQVTAPGIRLGWDSPVRGPVHPAYVNLAEEGSTGWLRGFDEWLVRCGLFSNGAPAEDSIETPLGGRRKVMLPLHGRIANIPAEDVDFEETSDGFLRVSATVNECVLFGSCLRLRTSLLIREGDTSFMVEDEVENIGGRPSEFQLLYHSNFGPPVVGPGSTIHAPFEWAMPRDEVAARGYERLTEVGPPVAGAHEQTFYTSLKAHRNGVTYVVFCNKEEDCGCSIVLNKEELPCFSIWKYEASEAEGYVVGLEPGTNYPNPKPFERSMGRVPVLRPGESHTVLLGFEILNTRQQVDRVLGLVDELDGLEGEPEPADEEIIPG